MKWSLAKGTRDYVEKEIIPNLDPSEYQVLKELANDIVKEANKIM